MTAELSPGLILILGALLVPLLRGRLRSAYMLALPIVALWVLIDLPYGAFGQINLFDMTLTTLRVDKLSFIFGVIFLIAAFLGVIYALHVEDNVQHVAGLIYAGSAVGAMSAGSAADTAGVMSAASAGDAVRAMLAGSAGEGVLTAAAASSASRPPAFPVARAVSDVVASARPYASANAARLASVPLPAPRTASSHAARVSGSAPLPASAPKSDALIAVACRRLIASMSNSTACFASARTASTMRPLSKRASPPLIFSRVV